MVKSISYETTGATIDSQLAELQGSGADGRQDLVRFGELIEGASA
jgi:hypothetical protein